MLKTNEHIKQRIKERIEDIEYYVMHHELLFNPIVEDLWRERSILYKRLRTL